MKTAKASNAGRPSKYDAGFPDQAERLCRLQLGVTDADLADFFEVSESTINLWKQEHPEFSESIKKGKLSADIQVANKLFDRATGAEWTEDQAFKVKTIKYDDKGKKVAESEEIVTVPVRRAAPPDTAAGIFWLKNRKSSDWRDKQDHEHTGKDGEPIQSAITVTFVSSRD